MSAAWYSPLLRLGQTLKTQIVRYKKTSLGIGSVIAAAALGYLGFAGVRNYKIRHLINDAVVRELPAVERRAHVLSAGGQAVLPGTLLFRSMARAEGSTWYKPWHVTLTPALVNGRAAVQVSGSNGLNETRVLTPVVH